MSYQQEETLNKVEIYSDGACSQQNDGVGGWGALIILNGKEQEIYGGDNLTTNNKMEMTACIKALEYLSERSNVTLFTDSKYIIDGITKWIKGWERKGWMTKDFQPVKNQDLWRRLDDLTYKHKINWQWVRGHSGNRGNEIADKLAVKGKEEEKLKIKNSIALVKFNGNAEIISSKNISAVEKVGIGEYSIKPENNFDYANFSISAYSEKKDKERYGCRIFPIGELKGSK